MKLFKEILSIINVLGPVILAVVAAILAKRHNNLTSDLSNDTLQKQLFTELNGRYDKLNDLLKFVLEFDDDEVMHYNESENDENIGAYKKSFIKFKINDYFNLCAEEYYWFSKNRIDNRIWNAWQKGMNDIYNGSSIIQEQWKDEIKNDGWKSFYLDKPNRLFTQ